MTLRGATPILLGALLVGGLWFGWKGEAASTSISPEAALPSTKSPRDSVLPKTRRALPLAAQPARVRSERGVVSLPASEGELLGEQAALQMLGGEVELGLTAEQWSDFAALTLHTQAVRHAYEASVATARVTGEGRYRVEIPAYPNAGDALRTKFYGELREKLGAPLADSIVARLGTALEGHFAGFGVSVQTLDFTADQTGADNAYQVVRTITFWDSVRAGERLTTRRETHFPGLEDPQGHSWGPFLALIATQLGRGSAAERG